MNKDSNAICPLGIIGRGCYTCSNNCALYYNDECLIKTYLLILTGVKQKETEEKTIAYVDQMFWCSATRH